MYLGRNLKKTFCVFEISRWKIPSPGNLSYGINNTFKIFHRLARQMLKNYRMGLFRHQGRYWGFWRVESFFFFWHFWITIFDSGKSGRWGWTHFVFHFRVGLGHLLNRLGLWGYTALTTNSHNKIPPRTVKSFYNLIFWDF